MKCGRGNLNVVAFKFQAEAVSKNWYVVYGLKNSPKKAKYQKICVCTNTHTSIHTHDTQTFISDGQKRKYC